MDVRTWYTKSIMVPKIYFIIGVNGVGKTTLLAHLVALLPQSLFELHDFDERGVPDNADKNWRISETNYWISRGEENKRRGASTVMCGFSKPEEIGERAEIILLDVNAESLEKRLRGRYQTEESLKELERTTGKSVEKFLTDNIYVSSLLRKSCEERGCKIIETSDVSPADVTQTVAGLINAGSIQ